MKSKRFQPRRYQLKKEGATVVRQGHPWIFRDKLSSAIEIYDDGQWLQLVDGTNETVGWGVYQATGGVGIRVLRKGENPPSREWYRKLVQKAIAQRTPVRRESEAFRVFNGESDKLPGIVLDVYNGYGVLQTYSKGVDSLGRYLAGVAYQELGLKGLLWKTPSKRKDTEQTVRLLRGKLPSLVRFQECQLKLAADLRSGQKSGTFLDLRGLRRWLAEQPMRGARVINLFSYTGAIGLACCEGGAREVLNVDAAQASLDFGAKYHNAPAQKWVCADIFRWIPELPKNDLYDWIIVDPPSMASQMDQVPQALAVYRRIYRQLLPHLKPGGVIIACCCTSRINPERFEQVVRQALGGAKVWQRLPMELDHKPGFAEANYLKILIFRPPSQRSTAPPGVPHPKAKPLPQGRPRSRKPTR